MFLLRYSTHCFLCIQVNLTVDCTTVDGSDEPLPLPAPPPPPRLARSSLRPSLLFDRTASLIPHRDSVSSASGLGLEPAMQATLFAFSHILRPAHSRDSISSDGKPATVLRDKGLPSRVSFQSYDLNPTSSIILCKHSFWTTIALVFFSSHCPLWPSILIVFQTTLTVTSYGKRQRKYLGSSLHELQYLRGLA